jgi:Mor family transcriptional regulator
MFLQGKDASDFTTNLFAIDFMATMENEKVWGEVKAEVREIMRGIFESKAFEQIKKKAD